MLAATQLPYLPRLVSLIETPNPRLAGYDGQEPQKQVAYFVAATDEDGRRWEDTCRADPADDWVPLNFSRAADTS
jgi:hypothetical protein